MAKKQVIDLSKERQLSPEISSSSSPLYEQSQQRPYNPATLYRNKDWKVYDEMREDDQINAILTIKKYMILSSEWGIECEDEEIKDFLEYALREKLNGGISQRLYEILSAIDYGFSSSEKIFSVIDDKRYGLKVFLSDLKTRPPHSFYLHTDDKGNLKKLEQYQDNGQVFIDPKKMFTFVYRKEFGNWYGNSDLSKAVYRSWWSKEAIIRFWNIFLERYGSPIAWGKYPQGQEGVRSTLETVLSNMQAKTSIVTRNDIEVELLTAARNGDGGYEKAIDKHNMLIARSMLVPDLAGMGGSETTGGSYSLGKEQFGMMYLSIEAVRKQLANQITQEIITPLAKLNFGDDVECRFVFNDIDANKKSEHLKLFLELLKTPATGINLEQVNWFLKSIDAPEISEEDHEEAVEIQQEEKEREKEIEDTQDEEIEEEIEETPAVQENKKKYEEKYFRRLTTYEEKANIDDINKKQLEVVEDHVQVLSDAYNVSINKIYAYIKKNRIVEDKKFSMIDKIQFPGERGYIPLYRTMLNDGAKVAAETIPKVKKNATEDLTDMSLKNVAAWVGSRAQYLASEEAQNILKIVKGTLQDGIRKSLSTQEIIKMIDTSLEGYDMTPSNLRGKDLTPETSAKLRAHRLETIVRTNVNTAFNQYRMQEFNLSSDQIRAYQYSAILDNRTSDLCRSLDGKILKPSEVNEYNPPLHYNCRSIIIPVFNDEEFEGFSDLPATEKKQGGFMELKK